ncbi:MAG: zinc ABC transporter substrate-binding protein [Acidilobaceae archaeon]
MNRNLLLGALVVVLVALLGLIIVLYRGVYTPSEGLTIVLLFPGIQKEVSRLLSSDDKLYVIGGAGVDPHELQLSPSDVEMIRRANIVLSMGHTHVDEQVESMIKRGEVKARFINVLEIKGLILPRLPDGKINIHEPYYDPRNLILILEVLVDEMSRLRPEKRDYYYSRLSEVRSEVEELISRYSGILKGYNAVLTTAELQPAVAWLGLNVVSYIVWDTHETPKASAIEEAIRALDDSNVIAVVAIIDHEHDHNHNHEHDHGPHRFMTILDKMIAEEANARGRIVIGVPPGWAGESILESIRHVILHATMHHK